MVRYLLFYILVVASVQSVINALMVGKPGLYRKAVMAFPCINSMKQRRILGRNTESHLRDNRNEFNAEDIASFIVDSAPTAQSVLNIPLEQENNPRQGKIYKSYQDFVSYIMKTPLWRDYSLSLTMKPVVTKSFSSMIGYFLGDIFAQLIFRKGGFNFARFLRMGAFGGLFHGPTGHLFYGLLERQFPGASTSAVVKKVTVDQLVWCPLFTVALFTITGITAGFSPREIFAIFKVSGPQAILSSWLIWPAAHAINFRVIPGRQRLLYINIIQLFFNAILSALANSAV